MLIVAAAAGVATGRSLMLGIGLGAGLGFALIMLSDLATGVCLFVLVTFLDVVSQNGSVSLTKAAGALLAGAWVAALVMRRESPRRLSAQAPRLVAVVLAFVAWSGLSAVWSESPSAAIGSTARFALDAMLLPIVFYAVREPRHVALIFAAFIVGTLLSVLWGLTQPKVAGSSAALQAGRLSGATVEANVLATYLIVSMVFASALALVLRRAPIARGLCVIAVIAAAAAFFGTFSRGGVVALAVVILFGCVYAGRWRSVFIALLIGVVLVGAVYVNDTTSSAVQRLSSTDSSGRMDIWKVGLRMVRAHPVVGVGSGNYTIAEPHYLLVASGSLSNVGLILTDPHVAHNIYLQVQAEMGIVGLILFLSIIAMSLGASVQAVAVSRRTGHRVLEILGRTHVIVLVGILTSDFFLSEQYSKQLWLLLGLGPALLAMSRSARADRPHGARPSQNGVVAHADWVRS